MTPHVEIDADRCRFVLLLADEPVGLCAYRDVDGVRVFHHTETSPAHGGKGFASILVRAALDEARASDRRVVPTCWYVRDWIAAHPDYAGLLAHDLAHRDQASPTSDATRGANQRSAARDGGDGDRP